MTTKDMMGAIGKEVRVRVCVGKELWLIPAIVEDVRLRYGVRDYQVVFNDQNAWVSESNVIFGGKNEV